MTFTPHLNPLRHQRPTSHGAAAWLTTLYGEPFAEPRSVLRADSAPVWVDPKDGRIDVSSYACLKAEWDDVALLMWCDGSCAIAFPKAGGYDVLPATFNLTNQVYTAGYKDVAWEQRATDLPTLHLRTDQTGFLWSMANGTITPEGVETLLRGWIWERVGEILEAGPVLDPRVHKFEEGGRFAPFSPFPEPDAETLSNVRNVLIAVAPLAQAQHIWVSRASASSPWRQGNTSHYVGGQRSGFGVGDLSKPWRTWLKAALFGPHGFLPASVRSAVAAGPLCEVKTDIAHLSAHQRLAAQAALSKLVHPTLLAEMPNASM